MPVFHQYESFERLQKYIDDWVEYIGISPANDCKPKKRLIRLKHVYHKYLLHTKVKTHWFWVTTYSILKEIPFFSCDSTSRLWGWTYNTFTNFSNGKLTTCTAKSMREKLKIDLWKMKLIDKRERNLRNIKLMEEYVNKLHKAKKIVYRE